ncbi:hypothetical protein NE237_004668 [Protea cynaroides]|uniref:Cornichon n=1 Tax=Protea cynaroides TaxID=273540 RepID=A0A9Q0KJB7_9MAGN|nr:hypothetical protein NE237_004668 [Protea cynaroides]
MTWELLLWLISFFVSIALLAVVIYQLICLSDLEIDCINPYDSSSRINAVVIPEFIAQGTLCAFYLMTWHWFMFLITAPVLYYHIKLYMKRQHFIDVTEIFRLLDGEKKHRMVKLAFYLLLFFIVIYSYLKLIITLFFFVYKQDGSNIKISIISCGKSMSCNHQFEREDYNNYHQSENSLFSHNSSANSVSMYSNQLKMELRRDTKNISSS